MYILNAMRNTGWFFTPSGLRSASEWIQFASDLASDHESEDPFPLRTDLSGAQSWITLEQINGAEHVFLETQKR